MVYPFLSLKSFKYNENKRIMFVCNEKKEKLYLNF